CGIDFGAHVAFLMKSRLWDGLWISRNFACLAVLALATSCKEPGGTKFIAWGPQRTVRTARPSRNRTSSSPSITNEMSQLAVCRCIGIRPPGSRTYTLTCTSSVSCATALYAPLCFGSYESDDSFA